MLLNFVQVIRRNEEEDEAAAAVHSLQTNEEYNKSPILDDKKV